MLQEITLGFSALGSMLYVGFPLSLTRVEHLLNKRGTNVSYETLR